MFAVSWSRLAPLLPKSYAALRVGAAQTATAQWHRRRYRP
ncbi:hypothetical protein GLA29479_3322 [Lysobacter antibioticus]|nr:hypothetical protein GLA29479_3322 [Lysobacter antibioticus]